MVQDGDSTNFLVGFHQTATASLDKELIENWLLFMNHDGGWVTYRNEDEVRLRLELSKFTSVAGWTASHSCVTAAAAYVLSTIPSLKSTYEKTCEYLISKLSNKTYWKSYWRTSDIYATSFAILALSANKENWRICEKPLDWLLSQQDQTGYWSNPFNELPDALYTALALKALIVANFQANHMSIKKGAEWLLKTQTNDGSWQTNRVLRIPATHIIHPDSKSSWRKSSFGVNNIVEDHNRFFTTSTVFNFLHNYSSYQLLCY
jgi:squalene cyclase